MTDADLDTLAVRIEPLAKAVGLSEAEGAHPARAILPPGGRVWEGRYAWLILWPVVDPAPAVIEAQWTEAERRLDEALEVSARQNVVIDGYVVLALPEPPTPETRAALRRAELGPRICRKHAVWWNGEGWAQMDTITLLGLPRLVGGGERAAFPALPTDQETLVERLDSDWRTAFSEDLRSAGLDPAGEAEK